MFIWHVDKVLYEYNRTKIELSVFQGDKSQII